MHIPLTSHRSNDKIWIDEIKSRQTKKNIKVPCLTSGNDWDLSEQTFIPRAMTLKNSDNTHQSISELSQLYALFYSFIPYSHVLLEGEAGSGKSTFLQYLIYSQYKAQHQFDLLVDISLNKLKYVVNHSTKLVDVLYWRYGLPLIDDLIKKEGLDKHLSNYKILWLLDGLDKVSDNLMEADSAFSELFYNCFMQQPYILLTSRKGHRALFNANHIIKHHGLNLNYRNKTFSLKAIHYQIYSELNLDPAIFNDNSLWPIVIERVKTLHWPAILKVLMQYYNYSSELLLKNFFYTAINCAAFQGLLQGQKELISIATCQIAYKNFTSNLGKQDVKRHITFELWLFIFCQSGFIYSPDENYYSFKHILFQEELAACYLGQLMT